MSPSTPYAVAVVPGLINAYEMTIPVFAASAIANADEVTDLVVGHNFEILGIDFVCVTAISTAAKTVTIKPYIDTVVVPGTATAVAGTKAKGEVSIAYRSDPTNRLYGGATSKIKLTASSVTAFSEGAGYWVLYLRNVGNNA